MLRLRSASWRWPSPPMIGGEFDLSAGVLTGSTAILMGLDRRPRPATWCVTRTSPRRSPSPGRSASACATASSSTGRRDPVSSSRWEPSSSSGSELGFTKMVTGRVIVEDIDEAAGFSSLRVPFASEFRHGEWVFVTRCSPGCSSSEQLARSGCGAPSFSAGRARSCWRRLSRSRRWQRPPAASLLSARMVQPRTEYSAGLGVGVALAVAGVGQWRYRPALDDDRRVQRLGWDARTGQRRSRPPYRRSCSGHAARRFERTPSVRRSPSKVFGRSPTWR